MKLFLLDTLLREAPENDISKGSKKIYLLDAAEFSKTAEGMPHKKKVLQDLSVVHYCKAELYGSCILGIIEVPLIKNENCISPQKTLTERLHFGFFIENTALFLIGETEKLLPLMHRMKENHFSDSFSILFLKMTPLFCKILKISLPLSRIRLPKTYRKTSASIFSRYART